MCNKDINYALVEELRPEVYSAMKYWGKKPHNIWRAYIDCYTPNSGTCLDPFAGSAISAFEAVKTGKKAIAFDLNPMTTFFIDVFTSKYDRKKFKEISDEIIKVISENEIYLEHYTTICEKCGNKHAKIIAYKWDSGNLYEVAIQCGNHKGRNGYRYTRKPLQNEIDNILNMNTLKVDKWTPDDEFRDTTSFSAKFIIQIGGKKFINLWTKRNLYILSEIFDKIVQVIDTELKKQLMYSFIQTLHLTTKMSVPRRPTAKRDFSTSWGRSAYLIAKRQMEMNPLHVFIGSCFGKQSTDSSLKSIKEYVGKDYIKTLYVDRSNKSNRSNNYDIKYGIIDALTITSYVDEKSVDFIITDPPYGGLVQYLDLSTIWLIWLKKFDKKYTPNYDAEITVNNKNSIDIYRSKFTKVLKNIHKVLKDDGKIVFTFHNNKIDIWNLFLNSIMMSGFKIEKVIHQQNRRTGESNVANPYGTSGTDFYIRCIKSTNVTFNTDKAEFEHFMRTTAIKLIAERNEPTPFQILFNGLLAELSKAGFSIEHFDESIESFLKRHLKDVFDITSNLATKAGDFWWFKSPNKHINQPDKPLTDRVSDSIINLLRRKQTVTYDEVLAEIFIQYPNGLTPNVVSIVEILEKYADKSSSSDKWVYKGADIEKEFTKHTEVIKWLIDIGKKMKYTSYVGRREQAEPYKNKKLVDFSDYTNVADIGIEIDTLALSRVEMIDLLWVNSNDVAVAIEVENSTNFISGIQRASNLPISIPKIMVIPDYREKELKNIKDPLFIASFKENNWNYIKYSEVEKFLSLRTMKLNDLLNIAKEL